MFLKSKKMLVRIVVSLVLITIIAPFVSAYTANPADEMKICVLDGEKLKKAHENPELYPDLVVRVTGFTAYFVSLSPKFRQLVVDRFLYGT